MEWTIRTLLRVERKQPQLEPRPFVADPQGLEKARPQVAPLPTPDLLARKSYYYNSFY